MSALPPTERQLLVRKGWVWAPDFEGELVCTLDLVPDRCVRVAAGACAMGAGSLNLLWFDHCEGGPECMCWLSIAYGPWQTALSLSVLQNQALGA